MTRIVQATRARSRRWLALPVLAVVVVVLVLVQGAFSQTSGSSKPANVARRLVTPTCGQTVSGNVMLAADLNCSAGDGLVVGAKGTTINLNGHTISGTPTGSSVGVLNGGGLNAGFTAVVVRNGTILGFHRGVDLGASGGTVQVVKLVDNEQYGIVTNGSAVISGNVAFGSVNGIVVGGGLGVKHTIMNNVSNSNSTYGIAVLGGPGSVVSGNRTLSNGDTGIYSEGTVGVTFTGNTANANGTGMHVFSDDPTQPMKVSANKAYFNDHLGIDINPGDTDLGKNTAGGNGSAHQCENVVCS